MFFQLLLLLRREVARFLGRLDLVKNGFELDGGAEGRYSKGTVISVKQKRYTKMVKYADVSLKTWYFPWTLWSHPPTPKKV